VRHPGDRADRAEVRAFAPGRVNLIGEHTDYTGGWALPMAIERGTTVTGRPIPEAEVRLRSDTEPDAAVVALDVEAPAAMTPPWARYVAGVVAELRPSSGFEGTVATTLPVGAGLSSSAALELAVALALGFEGSSNDLAALGQRAEQRSSGVPCGIMDQLTSAHGVAGHALFIDFTTLVVEAVALPAEAAVVVVHSGEARRLAGSAYAERRAACEAAATIVGPLRDATLDDLDAIGDPAVRRRARHVVTENQRVIAFAGALATADLGTAGELMKASHASLRDDFAVSTDTLDALVARLDATPGVYGSRLTGAGFGGCAVALTEPGALREGWTVQPSAGAHVDRSPSA
jgi:galactokinase